MKKILGMGALCLAVAVGVAQTDVGSRPDVLGGKSVILASGVGKVQVSGDGIFVVLGEGKVAFTAAESAEISVEGLTLKSHEGESYSYEGKGAIRVKGSHVDLKSTGAISSLRIVGRGEARLAGIGSYRGLGAKGDWTKEGLVLRFGGARP